GSDRFAGFPADPMSSTISPFRVPSLSSRFTAPRNQHPSARPSNSMSISNIDPTIGFAGAIGNTSQRPMYSTSFDRFSPPSTPQMQPGYQQQKLQQLQGQYELLPQPPLLDPNTGSNGYTVFPVAPHGRPTQQQQSQVWQQPMPPPQLQQLQPSGQMVDTRHGQGNLTHGMAQQSGQSHVWRAAPVPSSSTTIPYFAAGDEAVARNDDDFNNDEASDSSTES
ncbi:hypothetical protein PENTCL1PPCAC_10924, partial [Pristionchus entomophagus]